MRTLCRGEQEPAGGREELGGLRLTDPVKYARLAARLVTPGGGDGPCPPPSFPGTYLRHLTYTTIQSNRKPGNTEGVGGG